MTGFIKLTKPKSIFFLYGVMIYYVVLERRALERPEHDVAII
jgi:hypothetical protein